MKSYLNLLQDILDNGEWKDNRTGINCLTSPYSLHFRHDMSKGFPLLTTKKMAFRSMCAELECFIKGLTSKKEFQDRGCKFWDDWASPPAVYNMLVEEAKERGVVYEPTAVCKEEHERRQKQVDDLGPIYGYQWRNFGQHYNENDIYKEDYSCNEGFDQLKSILEKLQSNPNDRRMVVSAWNPNQEHLMALHPCHFAWGVTHLNGKLSLNWVQRSCDMFLGVPMNIASYALLLCLLCMHAQMEPGYLSGTLWDAHIYENHMDQVKEQLTREPRQLPAVATLGNELPFDILKWSYKDAELLGYHPHPKIEAPVAV